MPGPRSHDNHISRNHPADAFYLPWYLPDECGRFCTGSNGVMWLDTVVLVQHQSLRLLWPGVDRRSARNVTREPMITVLPRGHLWRRYIERPSA